MLKFACVFCALLNLGCAEVIFDWVTVGDPGNPGNSELLNGETFGVVDYTYRISKYEVTNAQYAEFLNAVGDESGTLFHPLMATSPNGGIVVVGGGGPDPLIFQSKAGYENKPVVFVNIFDAMTFVNWIDMGQPIGLDELAVSPATSERSPDASYFLPSVNEWYKAAAYNPDTQTYFRYATSSNEHPYGVPPPGTDAPLQSNTVNGFADDGISNTFNNGYALSGNDVLEDQLYLTDVGAYPLSISPYGTFDQTGNVRELIEGGPRNWLTMGGSWAFGLPLPDGTQFLEASNAIIDTIQAATPELGFRVASVAVPEPGNKRGHCTLFSGVAITCCSTSCVFTMVRRRRETGTLTFWLAAITQNGPRASPLFGSLRAKSPWSEKWDWLRVG